MRTPGCILPKFPHEGPPVPCFFPDWPRTPDDIERAVRNFAMSADAATYHYRAKWQHAIENYRAELYLMMSRRGR